LLSRKQVIENLQRDRGETVYLLSELGQTGSGGYLSQILKQDGLKINITGMLNPMPEFRR
jgi:type IV pilus assembly protein PilN